MSAPLVLGIDPGFASFGYALLALEKGGPRLAAMGVLRTKKSDKKQKMLATHDNLRRVREIDRGLGNLLNSKLGQVKMICAESMSFPRNASAAAKVAMTWGLIVAASNRGEIPILQASPQEVKRRVAGIATASKENVQNAMQTMFNGEPAKLLGKLAAGQQEHPYDALAAAVACLDSEEGRMLRSFAR